MKKMMLAAGLLLLSATIKTKAQAVIVRRPCARVVVKPRPVVVVRPASRIIVRPRRLRPAIVVVH